LAAVDAGAGRGAGVCAFAAAGEGRGAAGAAAIGGSGVMILTGGVEAALGKSALVGLPVGSKGGSAAVAAGAGVAGAFHDGE